MEIGNYSQTRFFLHHQGNFHRSIFRYQSNLFKDVKGKFCRMHLTSIPGKDPLHMFVHKNYIYSRNRHCNYSFHQHKRQHHIRCPRINWRHHEQSKYITLQLWLEIRFSNRKKFFCKTFIEKNFENKALNLFLISGMSRQRFEQQNIGNFSYLSINEIKIIRIRFCTTDYNQSV